MKKNKQDILRFEKEWRKIADIDKVEKGVYVLGGNSLSIYTSRNPIALLGCCIKEPACGYRAKQECDFSLELCDDDQTKIICNTLQEKNIPFYFIVDLEDVQKAIDDFHDKSNKPLDLCITLCCPIELTEEEKTVHYFIEKHNAPLLAFLGKNYEGCKKSGKSFRQFDGQIKFDTEQFKRVLNMYLKEKR